MFTYLSKMGISTAYALNSFPQSTPQPFKLNFKGNLQGILKLLEL